jgi:hypothetical protein
MTKGSEFESQYGQDFSLLRVLQTGYAPHPASYPMGALSPEVKRPGHETDHSPPTSAEVKKVWIYTSISPYTFMMCLFN